jgi:flagellar motor protein MotB
MLFDSGRAVLRPEARAALAEVANTLRDMDRYYRIEGHTDDIPTDPGLMQQLGVICRKSN